MHTAARGMVHAAMRGMMQHVWVVSTCLSLPRVVAIVDIGCGHSCKAARGMMQHIQVALTCLILAMCCCYCCH